MLSKYVLVKNKSGKSGRDHLVFDPVQHGIFPPLFAVLEELSSFHGFLDDRRHGVALFGYRDVN